MRAIILGLVMAAGLLAGCVEPDVVVLPHYVELNPKTYVILPFADANSAEHRTDNPRATVVVRDAFETEFLKTGDTVIDCGRPADIPNGGSAAPALNEEQGTEVAKRLKADAAIFGTVTAYYQGKFFGPETTVGFSVKAVHVSGVILWKASFAATAASDLDGDPALHARNLAKKLVDRLIDHQYAARFRKAQARPDPRDD